MSSLTAFDIEFFELSTLIKQDFTDTIKLELTKKLLKLNNPTYFYKFVKKHPIENHGLSAHKTINPVLVAVTNMISVIKSNDTKDNMKIKLQTEFAWAFNNYPKYSSVNL